MTIETHFKILAMIPKLEKHATFGLLWINNQLRGSLYVENATTVTYLLYENPRSWQVGKKLPLLQQVQLKKGIHNFGNLWNWSTQIPQTSSKELGYLIQVTRQTKEQVEKLWVLDPYARSCTGGEQWNNPHLFQVHPTDFSLTVVPRQGHPSVQGIRRLAVVQHNSLQNQQRSSRPLYSLKESIVYECHVRGMTQSPTADFCPPNLRGTYRGLVECIPHLQKLGITAIELLPVFEFDENENPSISPETGTFLHNYWGYSHLLFFAPKQSYAADPHNATHEFREMVNAFHEAGIEVWLDVVFNHTAELDKGGPADHFKYLAPQTYYLQDQHKNLMNYSGCGNTLHCAHPIVRRLIKDCLFYWVHEMGVDGFRFDLASILDRDAQGKLNAFPHLLWELRNHPMLHKIKLIAEPWDAGGGYQLGHFAYHTQWAEWNDVYRDSIRKTVRGDLGVATEFKQAVMGSPQIYQSMQNGRSFSLNFITAHDGMTLWDLVSYKEKHNDANGEKNRDGTNVNYSDHCGIEGKTDQIAVLELRWRKWRNFHALLQLSNGIPMLVAGDEFARTQEGNNNAYCLDSPLTWLNWAEARKHTEAQEFVQKLIAFRKQNFEFLFSTESHYKWFNSVGGSEDLRYHVRTFVWNISHHAYPDQQIAVLFNGFEAPLQFCLPDPVKPWICALDSYHCASLPAITPPKIEIQEYSLQVWITKN